jgi:hypothetical protein
MQLQDSFFEEKKLYSCGRGKLQLFKKILLVTAAMSAVMCMSVAAHAELQAEYADGSVTLSGIETEAAQKTLLILTEDATNIDSSAKAYAEGGIIVQIDQDTAFATVPVGTLADGTYYVRVGGDADKIETTTFKVGGTTAEKVLVGDANQDGEVTTSDSSQVMMYAASMAASAVKDGEKSFYAAAYCNGDGEVSTADSSQIMMYAASMSSANPLVGTEVEIGSIGSAE